MLGPLADVDEAFSPLQFYGSISKSDVTFVGPWVQYSCFRSEPQEAKRIQPKLDSPAHGKSEKSEEPPKTRFELLFL